MAKSLDPSSHEPEAFVATVVVTPWGGLLWVGYQRRFGNFWEVEVTVRSWK